MATSAAPSAKALPRVGSQEFSSLDFKQQLFILNLYLYDKDKYRTFARIDDPGELVYIDKSLDEIGKMKIRPDPNIDLPASFVEGCWSAYISYYDPIWWKDEVSPIEELGLDHKRMLGIQFFNFPLLSLDSISRMMLSWLFDHPKKTKEQSDVFYYLIKMIAAWTYFRGDDKELSPENIKKTFDPKAMNRIMTDIWNLSVTNLNTCNTITALNGDYPVVEDNERLIYLVEDNTLVLYTKTRHKDGRSYVSLIPSDLYFKSKFYIRDWDLLVA